MSAAEYSREAVFATAIRREREIRNWTQTDLAREMKGRGFPFHQQTIQRIEDGQRAVRLDEAYAVANIFGKRVDEMTWDRTAMRRNAASKLLWTGLPTSSTMDPVMEEFLKEVWLLQAIVEADIEDSLGLGLPNRTYAGIELLRRGLERADAIVRGFFVNSTDYSAALGQLGELPDQDEQDAAVSEDVGNPAERSLRALLDEHVASIPEEVAAMSLADLAVLFGEGERDGEPAEA